MIGSSRDRAESWSAVGQGRVGRVGYYVGCLADRRCNPQSRNVTRFRCSAHLKINQGKLE